MPFLTRAGVLAPLAALVLAIALFLDATDNFSGQIGIDFYHLWGVPAAHEALGTEVNPYAATTAYARRLNEVAAASTSAKLKAVNAHRRTIEPTGTPSFYAAFDVLPRDFDRAYGIFATLQFIATGAAVIVLARTRGAGAWIALCIAFAVELTFNPFIQDVKYGNVNSFQLLAVVALAAISARGLLDRFRALDVLYLGALAALLVFKPNTLWIAAALAAHYAVVRGPRRFAIGALVAVPVAIAAVLAGAVHFGGGQVWHDWVAYTQGANGGTLLYRNEQGNQALPMWLSQHSKAYGPFGYGLLLAAFLGVLLLAAMTALGKRTDLLRPTACALLCDAWFAASAGVVLTFAASPLLWPHYYVFALVPIFAMFRASGRWDLATACAIVTYLAMSRMLTTTLLAGEMFGALGFFMMLPWVPLVVGLCAWAAERRRALGVAPA